MTTLEKPNADILSNSLSKAQPSSTPRFQTCEWRRLLRSGASRPCYPSFLPMESPSVIQVTPILSRHPAEVPESWSTWTNHPAMPCQKHWPTESMSKTKRSYMPLCFKVVYLGRKSNWSKWQNKKMEKPAPWWQHCVVRVTNPRAASSLGFWLLS